MRVWISGGLLGGQFSSTQSIPLPADGLWHPVTFDLSASGMTAVFPADTLSNVLANVIQLRILSASTSAQGEHGDMIASTLGADDVRATTIPGDTNHDNTVNFTDLLTLAQHYGSTSAHWEDGDTNFDGTVNFTDLLALAQNYGSTVSLAPPAGAAQATVPEPMIALAAGGALAMIRRRRE